MPMIFKPTPTHRYHKFGLWQAIYRPLTALSLVEGDLPPGRMHTSSPRVRTCQICGFVETDE